MNLWARLGQLDGRPTSHWDAPTSLAISFNLIRFQSVRAINSILIEIKFKSSDLFDPQASECLLADDFYSSRH